MGSAQLPHQNCGVRPTEAHPTSRLVGTPISDDETVGRWGTRHDNAGLISQSAGNRCCAAGVEEDMKGRPTSMASNGNEGLMLSFASLEERGIEFRSLLWGGVLSLIVCGSALFALGHGGSHTPGFYSMLPRVPGGKAKSRIVLACEPIKSSGGLMVKVTAAVSGEEGGPLRRGE